ncbi:hypothetical protein DV736_g4161, partial [Chaetothyriales sp. CBS 134916]
MPEITIGEFIFRRLQQIGVETIFGVPGDYELRLLDFVEPAGSKWIGTPNELVGAYAADGIGITEDVVVTKVPASILETTKLTTALAPGPQDEVVVNAIVSRLGRAKNPIIIVDGGAARHDWAPDIGSLIAALEVPYFTTILGKGIVDEVHPLYGGCYAGASSIPQTSAAVENADCVLWLGNLPSDFSTGRFTEHVKSSVIIDFQRFFVLVGEEKYDARINHVLPRLSSAIKSSKLLSTRSKREPEPLLIPEVPRPIPITHEYIWNRFSTFLKPGDLVVTETGTAQLGITTTKYPSGVESWTQAVWGSIGYATGAAVGASIAAKEIGKHKRMIVFTGEGSLQLTVQAFSILNRHGIVPVVFVLNNNGYTVERYFNGWTAAYNDVPMWDYGALFKAFSPGEKDIKTFKVQTAAELDSLLSDKAFNTATHPQCVDMVMDTFDAPECLKAVFK